MQPRRAFGLRATLVVALIVAAYGPAFSNRYALDDALVLELNISVHRGIAGLYEIFTRDSYAGFYETAGVAPQLAGGRYRPLALATFAIEQSLFGKTEGDRFRATTDPIARADLLENELHAASLALTAVRHTLSILLYALLAIVLLSFLDRHVFSERPLLALASTIVFALHPVHTEVVANVKSRDEILSLLFVLLTLDRICRDAVRANARDYRAALAFFFLALLSKEYAVVLPAVAAVALLVQRGTPIATTLRRWAPGMGGVIFVYVVLRLSATGIAPGVPLAQQDLMNDPFLKLRLGEATGSVLATKLAILPTYLRLLAWPHPLSSDYSYATFAYATWTDARVWLSLGLHGALIAATIVAIRRRHLLGLALAWYVAFLLPVANVLFEIGATLGERLIFHASLGFALTLVWTLGRRRLLLLLVLPPILLAYGAATFLRTRDWRDDATLFLRDVQTVPSSALANANAGAQLTQVALQLVRARRLEKRELSADDRRTITDYTDRARPYLERALQIHPRFANAWINLGLLHWTRDEYAAAADAWARGAAILPSHAVLRRYSANFHIMGTAAASDGNLAMAIRYFEYATQMANREPRFWRDLAGARFMNMQFAAARTAFEALLALDPNDHDAARGRDAAAGLASLEQAAVAPAVDTDTHRAAVERFAAALEQNAAPTFRARATRLREELRQ